MPPAAHTPLMVHEETEGDATPVGAPRAFPPAGPVSRLGFNRENVDPTSGLLTLPRPAANSPLTPGAAAALARAQAMNEPGSGAPNRGRASCHDAPG